MQTNFTEETYILQNQQNTFPSVLQESSKKVKKPETEKRKPKTVKKTQESKPSQQSQKKQPRKKKASKKEEKDKNSILQTFQKNSQKSYKNFSNFLNNHIKNTQQNIQNIQQNAQNITYEYNNNDENQEKYQPFKQKRHFPMIVQQVLNMKNRLSITDINSISQMLPFNDELDFTELSINKDLASDQLERVKNLKYFPSQNQDVQNALEQNLQNSNITMQNTNNNIEFMQYNNDQIEQFSTQNNTFNMDDYYGSKKSTPGAFQSILSNIGTSYDASSFIFEQEKLLQSQQYQ